LAGAHEEPAGFGANTKDNISISISKESRKENFSLLINGAALNQIIMDEELGKQILPIFEQAKSVIIYRSSPDEKA